MANNKKYFYCPEGVGNFGDGPSPNEKGWVITQGKNIEDAIINLPILKKEKDSLLLKIKELKNEYKSQSLEEIMEITCGEGWEFFIIKEDFWDDYVESFE